MRSHQDIEQRSLALAREVVRRVDADSRHAALDQARLVRLQSPATVSALAETVAEPRRKALLDNLRLCLAQA